MRGVLELTAAFVAAATMGSGFAGCRPDVGRDDSRIGVVTTIVPLALVASAVGGSRVKVASLVPGGASPHAFEPKPSDALEAKRARLFLRIGPGFDDWVAQLEGAVTEETIVRSIVEADGLVLLRRAGTRGGEAYDPHVWLDPLRVRDALAPAIASWLSDVDPVGAPTYRQELESFQRALSEVDQEIREALAAVRNRRFVSLHESWAYFAERYDLEPLAALHGLAGEEPTPGTLSKLIDLAGQAEVPAILIEPQIDARTANVIGGELGARTVLSDPIGDPRDPRRSTYLGLMRFNARAFAEALGEPAR